MSRSAEVGCGPWRERRGCANRPRGQPPEAAIRYGLGRLAFGRRRRDLETKFNSFASRGFETRVFDFDVPAAEAYGDIVVARERAGRRLEGFDGLIAAIAKSRGLAIATRNIGDFAGCGIELISPWDAALTSS